MLPKDSEDQVHRYVETHQHRSIKSRERTPFRRQLDFWAFSIAYAIGKPIEPLPLDSLTSLKKFTDTRAVQVGAELSEWLTIVAFSKIGHTDESASDAAKIIEMCNRLAGAGAPHVLKQMQKGMMTPLESSLRIAESLVEQSRKMQS